MSTNNTKNKKILSICIPNYNRINEFKRLFEECISQILKYGLEEYVCICVCDDCSQDDPTAYINYMIDTYKRIDIIYKRNIVNMGMDYNFRESVLMGESVFSWIIGNDDVIEKGGLKIVIDTLLLYGNTIDFLVTPFDIRDEDGKYVSTTYPLGEMKEVQFFDSRKVIEYDKLINMVKYDSGFFVFLSNLVFRSDSWEKYKEKFEDKLNTIFLQVYMHIQKMEDGALYMYLPEHIIINYADDKTNNTVKRKSKMAIGLNDVIDYFYKGERAETLKRAMVDCYIYDLIWDTHGNNDYIELVKKIDSPKNNYYKKYFVPSENITKVFAQKKVCIWGAGDYGKKSINKLEGKCQSITIFDINENKIGTPFGKYVIESIANILNFYDEQTIVVVANQNHLVEMVNDLKGWGIDNIAIVS